MEKRHHKPMGFWGALVIVLLDSELLFEYTQGIGEHTKVEYMRCFSGNCTRVKQT